MLMPFFTSTANYSEHQLPPSLTHGWSQYSVGQFWPEQQCVSDDHEVTQKSLDLWPFTWLLYSLQCTFFPYGKKRATISLIHLSC